MYTVYKCSMYRDERYPVFYCENKEGAISYALNNLVTDEYWTNELSFTTNDNIFWVSMGQMREYIEIVKE